MIKYSKADILNFLNLTKSGNKGWYAGDCPYCNKKEHLGVIFGSTMASFNCVKCLKHGTLFQLLKHANRLDLVILGKEFIPNPKQIEVIKLFELTKELEIDLNVDKYEMPLSFRRVHFHPYLVHTRKINKELFKLHKIGISSNNITLPTGYIYFIIEEGGEIKGYVSRGLNTKPISKKRRRWLNSESDFSKLIYGADELLEEEVVNVIGVEGITDKLYIDSQLELWDNKKTKCISFFGKKISPEQIFKLLDLGIKKIILFFDGDAIEAMKETIATIEKYFIVEIAFINGDNDPGGLSKPELLKTINNRISSEELNRKISRKVLKVK